MTIKRTFLLPHPRRGANAAPSRFCRAASSPPCWRWRTRFSPAPGTAWLTLSPSRWAERCSAPTSGSTPAALETRGEGPAEAGRARGYVWGNVIDGCAYRVSLKPYGVFVFCFLFGCFFLFADSFHHSFHLELCVNLLRIVKLVRATRAEYYGGRF